MLQQPHAEDFVLATGETHPVREFVEKAFAIVRPPGHHSEPDEHMGFCFFNNVAVAIKVIQTWSPFKKIMILDW